MVTQSLLSPQPATPKNQSTLEASLSALIIGITALVFVSNYWIGHSVNMSVFYIPPILLGVIWVSFRFGLVMCFVSALLWVWIDTLGSAAQPYWIVIWNWLTRGLIFAAFCVSIDLFLRERRQSLIDPLTGIANRRWFQIFAEQEIRRFKRYQQPFTALYLDCDDFKAINDRLGHTGGDRLIRDIAITLSALVRSSDCVARLGGDEFGIILLQTDPDKAPMAAENVRKELKNGLRAKGWRTEFSIGAITYRSAPKNVDEILRASDALMYKVKRSGKDSVHHEMVGHE